MIKELFKSLLPIFFTAFAAAFALTPVARKLAEKVGAIDMPKARGVHTKPMPRFGGFAIYLGGLIAMLIFLPLFGEKRVFGETLEPSTQLFGLIGGSVVIFLIGVVDDIKGLSPKVKFIGQLVAALIVCLAGIRIDFIGFPSAPEGYLYFPWYLSYPITILWIVGITNTINLMDGLDGLAAGLSLISSACIAYIAYIHGWYAMCLVLLAVAGSAAGFLPWNFHPAKIFMGDSGSLTLGFLLATASLLSPAKVPTIFAVLTPVLVLALPIFDTFFAIVRRAVNRKPITVADKGHLHHRIMAVGMGQRRTVLTLYSICGTMGVAGIVISRGLKYEAILLMIFAFILVYVFIDDTKPTENGTVQKEDEE
ncbi:MAG: undecaprenyl/decaprenyl-phosphate alpha-N-acetylglucosaminyl 1-phosphate transferase [Firmicutes bacterium]|nr:undecaprenyl/decaprenyl-phosphate alpha-N-acetylglucosaminyl 1-phosphate transferase [Bacillota bacterium]